MAIIDYVNKIKEKYDYIIVSVISPLKKQGPMPKENLEKLFEVYTKCNLNVLIKRDTKKLYKKLKKI